MVPTLSTVTHSPGSMPVTMPSASYTRLGDLVYARCSTQEHPKRFTATLHLAPRHQDADATEGRDPEQLLVPESEFARLAQHRDARLEVLLEHDALVV